MTSDSRAETAGDRAPRRSARLGWSVVVLASALVLVLGSVRLEAGEDAGAMVRISTLWARLTPLLEVRGLGAGVVALVWGAVAIALGAAVWACWLALTVRDEPDVEDHPSA